MTLQLLICTIDEGIQQLHDHLLPQRQDVSYLISWQYTGEMPVIPSWIAERSDVEITLLNGQGLSRNRNHALNKATADILKICDDDERWNDADFDAILNAFQSHPNVDIIQFQARGLKKAYPPQYVSSVELAMRRESIKELQFDERFGLGSPFLNSGEEAIFIHEASKKGLNTIYLPICVCETEQQSTGQQKTNPMTLRSKAAVWTYTHGVLYAYMRALRESLGIALRLHTNPLDLFRHFHSGIKYIRSWHQ